MPLKLYRAEHDSQRSDTNVRSCLGQKYRSWRSKPGGIDATSWRETMQHATGRCLALLLIVALLAAACAAAEADHAAESGSDASTNDVAGAEGQQADADASGVLASGPSALEDRFDPSFPEPLVDPNDILPGGPPPDGIPPIDNPQFVTVSEADAWLNDPEPVLVVEIEGNVRA